MTAAAPPTPETTSFLDPTVLGKIGNLELLARRVVEGFINGLHRSPHLGASTDFAQHRSYMPGDDIRRIDWRLWARSDKYFIKEYEAETNTNFMVILDVSPSMRYGANAETGRLSKLTYGCYLAACLAYFSSMQRDRVGLATVDTDLVEYIPPSARHLQQILHGLARAEKAGRDSKSAPGKSTLEAPLKKLSESMKRKSLIAVISDFYEDPDEILRALAHARGRGNELIIFHLLDPHEIDFNFSDATNFIDMETGDKMPVIPEYLREQYRVLVQEHTAGLSQRILGTRADYAMFDTSKPLDKALFTFLAARQRFSRVR